ncbi:MAG: PilZ domain-containing protein [Nitrospinota bacterium]
MVQTICPRCQSKFYITVSEPGLSCPFCGFFFKLADAPSKRQQKRAMVEKGCDLLKGDLSISGHTVDISKTGVGVTVTESMMLDKGDNLHVVVKDFEIDSNAQVVWVKKFDNTKARAGLKFC